MHQRGPDQLISFLCLLKPWSITSWKVYRNTWKTQIQLEKGKIVLDQAISLLWWNDYISGQGKCYCCHSAWTSVKRLVPSSITSLLLNAEAWTWQMDCLMDKELAGWPCPKSYSQWLNVRKQNPAVSFKGPYWRQYNLLSLAITWTVGLNEPSANLQMTPSWLVQFIGLKEGMSSTETLRNRLMRTSWKTTLIIEAVIFKVPFNTKPYALRSLIRT